VHYFVPQGHKLVFMFDFAQLIAQQMQLETMTPTHRSLFVLGKPMLKKMRKRKPKITFMK
jgi:hypothetical protein